LLAIAALQTLVSETTATIEKILWRSMAATAPPSDGHPNERTYVDTFLATF